MLWNGLEAFQTMPYMYIGTIGSSKASEEDLWNIGWGRLCWFMLMLIILLLTQHDYCIYLEKTNSKANPTKQVDFLLYLLVLFCSRNYKSQAALILVSQTAFSRKRHKWYSKYWFIRSCLWFWSFSIIISISITGSKSVAHKDSIIILTLWKKKEVIAQG